MRIIEESSPITAHILRVKWSGNDPSMLLLKTCCCVNDLRYKYTYKMCNWNINNYPL